MIKPTVGRKVWYRPSASDSTLAFSGTQPLDATIVFVHSDNCVNLVIFDANGTMATRCSAYLKQGDCAPFPKEGGYAEWMPYQVGQAKKDEQQTSGTATLESPSAKDWGADAKP